MFSLRVLFVVALAIAAVFAAEEVVKDKRQVLLGSSYGYTGYAGYGYPYTAGYAGIPAVPAVTTYSAYGAYPYGRYFY